jgi:hypothetical protein
MRKYLMAGAATAALILGVNQVMAQSTIGGADKAPAAASQSAPGASTSGDMKKAEPKTVGQSQSRDEKSDLKTLPSSQQPSNKAAGASDELKSGDMKKAEPKTVGQSQSRDEKSDLKTLPSSQQPSNKGAGASDELKKSDSGAKSKMTTGQSKGETDMKGAQAPSSPSTKMGQQPSTNQNNAQAPSSSNTKMGQQPSTNQNSAQGTPQASPGVTTGAASSGAVQLTEQQRTEVRQKVLVNAPRESNVNFALNVGTAVPHTVRVVAVPEVLIRIHPEWRRHRFFVVNDEIIIVDNDFRIIAILPV